VLDNESEYEKAKQQLIDYARSEDFECPPPFLLLYSGKASRTAFYRLKTVADTPAAAEYELLDEIWEWSRIKDAHLRGAFAEEIVTDERLLEILLYHLDRIEDDLRADVLHAVEIVSRDEPPALLTDFGQWLVNRPEALRRLRQLYERKSRRGRQREPETGRRGDDHPGRPQLSQQSLLPQPLRGSQPPRLLPHPA